MWMWWLLLGLPLAVWLSGKAGLWSGQRPSQLGATAGLLSAPSLTRNSVSSQVDAHPGHPQADYARIAPYRLRGTPQDAMARLLTLLATQPGVTVVQATPTYAHLEARTPFWGFVDDVEFLAVSGSDPGHSVIHLRSASRLGREDFGANRRRIDHWRQLLPPESTP